MPDQAGYRKSWLVVASVLLIAAMPFLSGCSTTIPEQGCPITDLAYDSDRDHVYIGTSSRITPNVDAKPGGGLGIYDVASNSFSVRNSANGLDGNTVYRTCYDSLAKKLYLLHHSGGRSKRVPVANKVSLFDPDTDRFTSSVLPLSYALAPAGDRCFEATFDNVINCYNISDTSSPTRIYSLGGSTYSGIAAMTWAEDTLYFSTSSPNAFLFYRNGTVGRINWTGSVITNIVAGPAPTVYLATDSGLRYYDSLTNITYNTSCNDRVIDVATGGGNVFLLVHDGSRHAVKSYLTSSDLTTALFDDRKCTMLNQSPTSIALAPTKNYILVGTSQGLITYNHGTGKISTKTHKDGLPLDPTHSEGPGFEAIAAVAVVATVVGISRYRKK